MSALREWAASRGEAAHRIVAVSSLGKLKTATQVSYPELSSQAPPATALTNATSLQMLSLVCLLVSARGTAAAAAPLANTGVGLLVVATYLTLLSLFQYMRALWAFQ